MSARYTKGSMKNKEGFTLVELMIVVALMGVIAAIAIPVFFSWLPNIRHRAASRDLFLDMQLAKMEAIKRNVNVVVTFTPAVGGCPGLPNAVPAVGGGYLVFIDDGAGGGTVGDTIRNGGEVTLTQKTMPRDVALCVETFGGTLGFLPTGLLVGNNANSATLNNNRGRVATVAVTIAGGIRVL